MKVASGWRALGASMSRFTSHNLITFFLFIGRYVCVVLVWIAILLVWTAIEGIGLLLNRSSEPSAWDGSPDQKAT